VGSFDIHQWRLEHKQQIAEYNQEYRQKHKQEILERNRKYVKTKKGQEVVENSNRKRKTLGYFKKWHSEHKQAQNIRSKQWRDNHKEYHNKVIKEWKKKNRIKVNEYEQQRRISKLELVNKDRNLIQRVYEDNIKKFGTLTCVLCNKTIEFGKDSIEHLVPLCRSGKHIYENLAIAHLKCNLRKNKKTLDEWRIHCGQVNFK
jgi:5-methylcytosine-specific restriction endonuclease McrA